MRPTIIVPRAPKIIVPRSLRSRTEVYGLWEVEHWRAGRMIHRQRQCNLFSDQGLNHMLDVTFRGVTQVNPWYMAIFEGNYTPVAGVTAASFTADATESTAYDEATRVEYNEAAAVAKSTTNSANKAVFTMNATKTIYGAALLSASAKSATTGTLGPATRFATARAVIDNDVLNVTYTVTLASSA